MGGGGGSTFGDLPPRFWFFESLLPGDKKAARETRSAPAPGVSCLSMAQKKLPEKAPLSKRQLRVTEVAIKSLKLDPKNVRRHSERNLSAIEASLRDHGQVEPVIVQAKTMQVIAGHGRLEALTRIGAKSVQVVEIDCDAKTAKLLGIRLNKTAELGEWDFQGLSEIFSTLDYDDQLRTGFADFEIEPLLHADWAPPAIEQQEFSRAGSTEKGIGTAEGTLTFKLSAEQTELFRRAQAAHQIDDPIAFVVALCESALEGSSDEAGSAA